MTDDATLGRARWIIDEGEEGEVCRSILVARRLVVDVASRRGKSERAEARKSGGGVNVDADGDDDDDDGGDETRGEGDARG